MKTSLSMDVIQYLYDAGFNNELYELEDFNNNRDYVEVFFIWEKAVDFIKQDIINSEYSQILEIKKYRHEDGKFSAIITYID